MDTYLVKKILFYIILHGKNIFKKIIKHITTKNHDEKPKLLHIWYVNVLIFSIEVF
jgi:hypothetical protein